MSLLERYNSAIRQLNELDNDPNYQLFEEAAEEREIKIGDVEWIENHFDKMDNRYRELKLGKYEN